MVCRFLGFGDVLWWSGRNEGAGLVEIAKLEEAENFVGYFRCTLQSIVRTKSFPYPSHSGFEFVSTSCPEKLLAYLAY